VETGLRFFITANPEKEWIEALPHVQSTMNNSKNVSRGVEPMVR
jgi:hypothetical protein